MEREIRYRKAYVTMQVNMLPDGRLVPTGIIWEDGHLYPVDRVRAVTRAAAQKVGGCGDRYTLVICGKERYFYNDDGIWFTEIQTIK